MGVLNGVEASRVCRKVRYSERQHTAQSNVIWAACRVRYHICTPALHGVAAEVYSKPHRRPVSVQGDSPSYDRKNDSIAAPLVLPRTRKNPARRDTWSPAGSRPSSSGLQWQSDLVWRSAFLFFCGSILFAFSSLAGLFISITCQKICNRLLVAYPYAIGSVLYTWGAYSSVRASSATLNSFPTPDSRASSQISSAQSAAHSSGSVHATAAFGGRVQRCSTRQYLQTNRPTSDLRTASAKGEFPSSSGRGTEQLQRSRAGQQGSSKGWTALEAVRPPSIKFSEGQCLKFGKWSDYGWALLDRAALVGVWIGTMLYNVSCITPAVLCSLPVPLPPVMQEAVLKWAVDIPNVVAGCLFVSGSYACWAASAKTFSIPALLRGHSGTKWGFLLYLLGSVGFLSGSLLTRPLLVIAPTILIDEWLGMFAGYFLGSLCFLSGSFLTIATPAKDTS